MRRRLCVEHKTTSSDIEPGGAYWKRLTLDTQVSQYLGAGEGVDGMLYDVIRKPGLRPYKATPPDERKYTKAGTIYASQRENDETPSEYEARLVEDIAANPNKYYQRGVVVRLEHETIEAARDTWLVAGSIRESVRLNAWPRNPGACDSYGRTCDYWQVCAGQASLLDDALYRTAAEPHEELPGLKHRLPLLTNSAMSTYRSCPRRYLHAYVARRRPVVTPHALAFGTLMHRALEVWWTTVDLPAALAVIEAADPFDVVKARALMAGYHTRWADEAISVLAVERAFVAPLLNPETGAASRTFELGGKCDAIAEVET